MDWATACTMLDVLGSAMPRDGALERELRESILTACGQRVGLMTRAAARQSVQARLTVLRRSPQSLPSS